MLLEKSKLLFEIANKVFEVNVLESSKKAITPVVWARMAVSVVLRHEGYGLALIGLQFDKDHSTVIHYLKKHHDMLSFNRDYRELFFEFMKKLHQKEADMPTLQKVFTLEVTPEQYLNACSDIELQELQLLLSSPRFANRINKSSLTHKSQENDTGY